MSFAGLGYTVYRKLVPDKIIHQLRIATGDLCMRFRAADPEVTSEGLSMDQLAQAKPLQALGYEVNSMPYEPYIIGNLCKLDGRFIEALTEKSLWNQASALLEVPVNEVVYHFSNLTRKPARIGPKISWHRDYPNRFICTQESSFMRFMIPLQKTNRENGGLGFIPASHLVSDEVAKEEKTQEPTGIEPDYPELHAGDIVAIHSKVIHGSPPNRKNLERNAIIVQFGTRNASVMHCEKEFLSFSTRETMLSCIRLKSDAGFMGSKIF